MKACTACHEEKPDEAFYWTTRKNGDKARHSKCQECRRAQFKLYDKTDAGKRSKRVRAYREHGYAITTEEYDTLSAKQKGLCAICGRAESKRHRTGTLYRLSVDHCHKSGRIRALLCSACNVGLGSFKENSDLLVRAANYLIVKELEEQFELEKEA